MTMDILTRLAHIVGERHMTTGPAVAARQFPWSTHARCEARAIVCPETTDEVSQLLAACNEAGQPVVPFGGTTNLVHGCATGKDDIVLSLERMNRIESVNAGARTLTAQAGVTMQAAQSAAAEAHLYFPVDIGARSNCQLGGIVAMNAGGTKVIRYGMARQSVLGLEAVLADGTVLTSMNKYLKNNSGFDLKQLFIGSEGVLGVITRVVFRLSGSLASHNVALLACERFEDVVELLGVVHERLPNTLTAFEVMWDKFYRLAVQPAGRLAAPLTPGNAYYVLVESMGADEQYDTAAFEGLLESVLAGGLVVDGMLAKSGAERQQLWTIRDEVEPVIGAAQNFDVSLESSDVGPYVAQVEAAVQSRYPAAEVVAFGHLGDNNVHVSIKTSDASTDDRRAIEAIVYEHLAPYAGAISAEHGIGIEKKAYLPISRTPAEIGLMTALKRSLDPNNILNPGKVVDGR